MRATDTYSQIHDAWILTQQQLLSPRYKAALKLVYSHFRFTTP